MFLGAWLRQRRAGVYSFCRRRGIFPRSEQGDKLRASVAVNEERDAFVSPFGWTHSRRLTFRSYHGYFMFNCGLQFQIWISKLSINRRQNEYVFTQVFHQTIIFCSVATIQCSKHFTFLSFSYPRCMVISQGVLGVNLEATRFYGLIRAYISTTRMTPLFCRAVLFRSRVEG